MYALEIAIEGKCSMPGEQPWLGQELQKLLDRHAPFIPEELKVVTVRAYETDCPDFKPAKKESQE